MATELNCLVVPGGLRVMNSAEAQTLERFIGKEVRVKISRPRNLEFFRKWHALLRTTLDMIDLDLNYDQWRWMILTGVGHCDYIEAGSAPVAIPRSVSFAKMDDTEFEILYDNCIQHICNVYIDDDPARLRQILEFV